MSREVCLHVMQCNIKLNGDGPFDARNGRGIDSLLEGLILGGFCEMLFAREVQRISLSKEGQLNVRICDQSARVSTTAWEHVEVEFDGTVLLNDLFFLGINLAVNMPIILRNNGPNMHDVSVQKFSKDRLNFRDSANGESNGIS